MFRFGFRTLKLCTTAIRPFINPKTTVMLSCATFCTLASVWFIDRIVHTVPYTNRNFFVLISRRFELRFGERILKCEKNGNILPTDDPKSVKVSLISAKIINSLYQTLDVKQDEVTKGLLIRPIEKKKCVVSKRVKQYIESLKWEVIVVDEPRVNAFCIPGGKIVIYTGFLNLFNTDVEIAACIGQEVGHTVARHSAEKVTKYLWFAIQKKILSNLLYPDTVERWLYYCKELPFWRRMEFEADYIGMLLMASAGFDPRGAPEMFRKMATLSEGDGKDKEQFVSTHPSRFKRAKFLEQDIIMSKAISMYDEAAKEVVQ